MRPDTIKAVVSGVLTAVVLSVGAWLLGAWKNGASTGYVDEGDAAVTAGYRAADIELRAVMEAQRLEARAEKVEWQMALAKVTDSMIAAKIQMARVETIISQRWPAAHPPGPTQPPPPDTVEPEETVEEARRLRERVERLVRELERQRREEEGR